MCMWHIPFLLVGRAVCNEQNHRNPLLSHSQPNGFIFVSFSSSLCSLTDQEALGGKLKLKDFFKVSFFISKRSKPSSGSLSSAPIMRRRSADFRRPGKRRLQDVVWWISSSVLILFFIYILAKGSTKIDSAHQFSRV